VDSWIQLTSDIVGEDKLLQGFFLKFKPQFVAIKLQKRLIEEERKTIKKHLTQGLRKEIFHLVDEGKCCYCNRPLSKDEVYLRYLVPLEKGGRTEFKNIITVCETCSKRRTIGSFAVKAEDIHECRKNFLYNIMDDIINDMYSRMSFRKTMRLIGKWLENEKKSSKTSLDMKQSQQKVL